MKQQWWWVIGGLVIVGVAVAGAASPTTVHQAMSQVIAPQAQIVWNISNAALDDDGNVASSKLTDANWQAVQSAAQSLKNAAHAIAQGNRVIVAVAGTKIQDEGTPNAPGAKEVQGYIDADSKTFRARAHILEASADKLIVASTSHDAATFGAVSNSLDTVCEDCHKRYWYPELKKK